MVYRRIAASAVMLLAGLATAGFATADHQPVYLATGTDYAPYVSDQLPEGGVVSEVVREVFASMGYQSQLNFYPWNRAYQLVLNVQSDATFPYAWGAERARDFLYSRVINRVTVRVFLQAGSAIDFQTPADLQGLSYCQPLGYQTEPELQVMIDNQQLSRLKAQDMPGCFRMLSAGRVDFVVSNELVALDAISQVLGELGDKSVRAAVTPFRELDQYLIISKQHPRGESLITEFNRAYGQLYDNGRLDQIWQQRLGSHVQAVK